MPKSIRKFIISAILLISVTLAFAQEDTLKNNFSPKDSSKLAFEISGAFFEGIYIARLSYSLWEYGDISGGFLYRHVNIDQGFYNVYSPVFAYRQYIWKNLHLEYVIYPAYAEFQYSGNNNNKYAAFRVWSEFLVGYKIDFTIKGFRLFIIPQPGIGFSLYKYSEWPDGVKPKGYDKPTFIPEVYVGFYF